MSVHTHTLTHLNSALRAGQNTSKDYIVFITLSGSGHFYTNVIRQGQRQSADKKSVMCQEKQAKNKKVSEEISSAVSFILEFFVIVYISTGPGRKQSVGQSVGQSSFRRLQVLASIATPPSTGESASNALFCGLFST